MKSLLNLEKIKKYNVFLYFSAIIANLAMFSTGCVYVWSSPAIPRLNGRIDPEHNPLKENITPLEESWIASLVPLGAAISAFISGYLSDKIGRKRTLLASGLPMMIGFAILTVSTKVVHLYIGRFLCGLAVGTGFTIIPIYIGEIAQSTNRGTLGCFLTFFLSSGNMYIYILAPIVSLKILSASSLVIPIIFLILFGFFIPESPYYYISKDKLDLARESLRKFRFNSEELVNGELPIIIKDVQESFRKRIGLKEIFQDVALKRGFGISLGLMAFQQFSGINAVFFYMQSIFEEAGSSISSDTCVLIAGIIQILASIITLPTVDKFGRRFLLLTSAIGNTLSNFVGGIYFILRERTDVDVTNLSWLPIITINLFIMTYTLGYGPVSFTMIGELFPPHVKSLAATLNIFVCLLSVFIMTNIFPFMKESIGLGLSFNLLAVICCIGGIFVYFKVPETKGKRLEEIQEILRQNKISY